jgi:hypothetical protein
MLYHIINSFINSKLNTSKTIHNYIKCHTNDITINLDKELKELTHSSILSRKNNIYILTKKGFGIMNHHIKYNINKIISFYRKYKNRKAKYVLTKYREEQCKMRQYLINNKQHMCILCSKKLPLCLLDTAHIKPYCLLNNFEKQDTNNVEFMCKYCHVLYDKGFIGINKGNINISLDSITDIISTIPDTLSIYNNMNSQYFNYHYKFLYKH